MRLFLPRGKKLKRTRNVACRVGGPSGPPVWWTARGSFSFWKSPSSMSGLPFPASDPGAHRSTSLVPTEVPGVPGRFRERQGSALSLGYCVWVSPLVPALNVCLVSQDPEARAPRAGGPG